MRFANHCILCLITIYKSHTFFRVGVVDILMINLELKYIKLASTGAFLSWHSLGALIFLSQSKHMRHDTNLCNGKCRKQPFCSL